MEEKIKLILEMLNENPLDDFTKDQEGYIKDYKENGWGDVHPGNIEDMKTGYHYSHGYGVGHTELLKDVNKLFGMSFSELEDLKMENKRISRENKEYMENLLKDIKGESND